MNEHIRDIAREDGTQEPGDAVATGLQPWWHESWWLVESMVAPRTLYYAGHQSVGNRLAVRMVDDPQKAARFPDEWGAKYALAAMHGTKVNNPTWPIELMGYRVAEHIFDYTPRGTPAADGPTAADAIERLQRERDSAVLAERERCAKLCDEWRADLERAKTVKGDAGALAAEDCAAAIRNQSKEST